MPTSSPPATLSDGRPEKEKDNLPPILTLMVVLPNQANQMSVHSLDKQLSKRKLKKIHTRMAKHLKHMSGGGRMGPVLVLLLGGGGGGDVSEVRHDKTPNLYYLEGDEGYKM